MKSFLLPLLAGFVLSGTGALYAIGAKDAPSTVGEPTQSTGIPGSYNLAFDATAYTTGKATFEGTEFSYRAYEGIVYVRNPVDVAYQTLNFYVRTEYYSGGSVGTYTAATAPIWLPNTVGGYMPGAAATPGSGFDGKPNSLIQALAEGMVVAAPGARGRTLQDAQGVYYGKAPAAIVDLKAAVRYLRYNDATMPGNAERIVSNGTSAGGALSALLGATGNNADYEPYLKALGAAGTRDDIWAVSAYCPITNLDHADAAYEWLLGGLSETKAQPAMPAGGRSAPPAGGVPPTASPAGTTVSTATGAAGSGMAIPTGQTASNPWGAPAASGGPLSDSQKALSARLSASFPAYLNSLGLSAPDATALKLEADGKGTFFDYLVTLVSGSAQRSLDSGTDFAAFPYVTVDKGKVIGIQWNGFITNMGRKKSVPAFDTPDAGSGENNLFGTTTINSMHFTPFGSANDTAGAGSADPHIVAMMNPLGYIGKAGTTTSAHWRIRHGTADSDTSLAIPVILALSLQKAGHAVDFALSWNVQHSGDYDLHDNFAWIASLTR